MLKGYLCVIWSFAFRGNLIILRNSASAIDKIGWAGMVSCLDEVDQDKLQAKRMSLW